LSGVTTLDNHGDVSGTFSGMNGKETETLREYLPQCPFAHQKFHIMIPSLELGATSWNPVTNNLRFY
jgi:hypothetical protein